ncbi:hypothetical protein VT06_15800 [Arsukibacterium sp. MJ3]|uniref:hypothetical protein n=1 Tax=Arsukibacterium sp. MJ3 TaxID=1632859 RepID=UPI000626F2E3|nr:hypothetical protein [Arsukibacterium sp. MJ3]KKO47668.1 hypothetical protein VT06_15800 [Arsukibacterium sp. MJ3]
MLLINFEQFCQQEHWQHQPYLPLNTVQPNPDFALWQRWLLRKTLSHDQLAQFPAAAVALHQGWQQYHLGEYTNAFNAFSTCLLHTATNWPAINLDAALGICRLYTRTGHWLHARHWGLYALQLSRQHNRLFDISRSFNVLGDVFCRAGHTQLAHVFLMTSANVLPQGSVHKARHYNSLATTLLRQKALLRAEAVLMNSLYLAKDTEDTDSIWHALARLQWLYLEIAPGVKVTARFSAVLPAEQTPVALSYIELALAAMALNQHDEASASQLLLSAAKRTSAAFPVESAWFARCAGLNISPATTAFLNLPKQLPDTSLSTTVFDQSWLNAPLANEQLNWLTQRPAPLSAQRLLHERQYFFI